MYRKLFQKILHIRQSPKRPSRTELNELNLGLVFSTQISCSAILKVRLYRSSVRYDQSSENAFWSRSQVMGETSLRTRLLGSRPAALTEKKLKNILYEAVIPRKTWNISSELTD